MLSSTDENDCDGNESAGLSLADRGHANRESESGVYNNIKAKLDQMVKEHKATLERMREKERANNEEMFALITYRKSGDPASADNITKHPPVMHEGINLMQIPAGHSASKIGRHLAGAMFGNDEDCKLIGYIIGLKRRRKDNRIPVPEDERAKFEVVVRSKYPKYHETAYNEARHAANQMGLDIKLKVIRKNRFASKK